MPLLAYTCVFADVADEFLLKNSTIKMVKIDIINNKYFVHIGYLRLVGVYRSLTFVSHRAPIVSVQLPCDLVVVMLRACTTYTWQVVCRTSKLAYRRMYR
jgi:hypothetical protein